MAVAGDSPTSSMASRGNHCDLAWHASRSVYPQNPHAAHHARVVCRPNFVVADQRDAQLRFLVIGGGL